MSASKKKFTSGHCVRLELENFKSWRGKHSVGPFTNGFTAIVGSNGAGKSNLMDAISFVTGVKAKKLRGDQLKDLIYDGDKRAEEENRHMSVTMIYSCGKNEVQGMREGQEIVFTRSVTHATAGSIFAIGNRRVTYEEFKDMLSKLNILVDARNFLIFQGDVEATASKSPADLSLFFEQVSGSEVFREEYDRCLAQKLKLESELDERIQQVQQAKAESKEAKEAKKETDQYNNLLKEQEDLRVEFALFQVRGAQEALTTAKSQLEEAKAAVIEAEKREKAMDQERKQAQTELSAKSRQLSKTETAASAASKKANAANSALAKKSEAAKREATKRKDAEAKLASAKKSLEEHKSRLVELKKLIADWESKEKSLSAQLKGSDAEEEEEEDKTELSKEQKLQLEKLRLEADKANAELRAEELRLNREMEAVKNQLELAKNEHDQIEARVKQSQVDKADQLRTKERTQQNVAKLQSDVAKFQAASKDRDSEISRLTAEIEAGKEKLEQVKQLLSVSKARKQEHSRSRKAEEIAANLKRNFEGVKGRLMDLVRPTNKKYGLAVDTALGKHMDAIIVTREDVAMECLKFLRDQRIGQATFLPLDSIKPKEISESKRKVVGHNRPYRFCVDLLEYDDASIERAVRFAAGDSIVCDTLDDARTLCFKQQVRVKAVTLQGHLISPRGDMTGGAMGDQGRTDRFTENALAKAREEKDLLEKDIAESERKIDQLRAQASRPGSELTAAQTSLKFVTKDLENNTTKLKEVETRLEKEQGKLKESEKKLKDLEMRAGEVSEQLASVRDQIAKKEEQLFKTVTGIKGNVREVERREAEARAAKREQLATIHAELGKLRGQLTYLDSQNRDKDVAECEESVKKCSEQVAKLEAEVKELKAEAEEADRLAKDAEQERTRAAQEVDIAQAKVSECQNRLEDASKEKGAASKRVTQNENDYQKARKTKADIITQAALAGLALPMKKSKGDDNDNDADSQEEEEDEDEGGETSAMMSLKNAADAKPDFAVLAKPTCRSAKEYNERLEQLAKDAESLAPNQRAELRLKEASDKQKTIAEIAATARVDAIAAEEAYERVRKQRTEMFLGMFNHVSARIDNIYRALTARPSAPAGGSAALTVVDENNPFSGGIKFECRPPNKRFRAMEQLSGGEKTIAALALLFAIHSYRPSPFFVLDEVDAALDNDNVERVSNYIRMRSSQEFAANEQQQQRKSPGGDDEDDEEQEDDDDDDDEGRGGRRRKRARLEDNRRFQSLVISLKDSFFSKAEALVGVYKDNQVESSKCLTLDLSQYNN